MASHWNSKNAIWRDLSVAQGRAVPAQIDHTVAHDERPPRLLLTEETEEEFFSSYVGGGDYSAGPDLELIQTMLEEAKRPTEEECAPEVAVETKKRPAKNRNLAIESLLAIHNDKSSVENGHVIESAASGSCEDVCLNPAVMFKKKDKRKEIPRSSDSPASVKSDTESEQTKMFVPTSRATEYYNKYYEKSKALERAREDVWSRAQREMRELDKKRKMEAVSPSSNDSDAHGMDAIQLSEHRHKFTEAKDCVVCQVLCTQKEPTQDCSQPK